MKLKSLFQIFAVFFLIFLSSCTKNENVSNVDSTIASKEMVFKSVTEKEYQEATPFTKRLIDKIDASANALNIIEKKQFSSI